MILQKKFLSKIDSVGFLLSLICAIHCMVFPILLVILPLLGLNFLLNATAEKAFVLGSVVLAGFSLFWGFRYHHNKKALFVYGFGAILLLCATFFMGHGHSHAGEQVGISQNANFTHHVGAELQDRPQGKPLSLFLLVLGGVSIAISHLMNKRLCHTCPSHHFTGEITESKVNNLSV